MTLDQLIESKTYCPDCDKPADAYFHEDHGDTIYVNVLCHGENWIIPICCEAGREF